MTNRSPFSTLKTRYAVIAIVVLWYWQPGIDYLYIFHPSDIWYWPLLVHPFYSYLTMFLFLVGMTVLSKLDLKCIHGELDLKRSALPIVYVTVLTLSASMALVTVIFYPLSYLFPEFVSWWINWWFQPVVYLNRDGSLPFGANLIGFMFLVIVGPITEEYLFRGYILRRIAFKWGIWPGILLSSTVFGAIHPDPLGAVVTGIGFALLYLSTKTLWAPIIARGIYNMIVWVWDYVGVTSKGLDYYQYSLSDFRSDWWLGVVGAAIFIFLIDLFVRRNWSVGNLAFPNQTRN